MNISDLTSEILTNEEKADFCVDMARIASTLNAIEHLAVSGDADEYRLRGLISSFPFLAEKLHHMNERLTNINEVEPETT